LNPIGNFFSWVGRAIWDNLKYCTKATFGSGSPTGEGINQIKKTVDLQKKINENSKLIYDANNGKIGNGRDAMAENIKRIAMDRPNIVSDKTAFDAYWKYKDTTKIDLRKKQ